MFASVGHQPWVVILTDLKNMAVCQEGDKQDFNFQKHIFGRTRFIQWALKQFFEEIRRIDLLWEIAKYKASLFWCLMFMNFVALILYYVKHALLSFSMKLF
jgi:hypothetical protein